MNRTELVNAMAEKAHTSKRDAEIFLRTFIDIVEHEIAEGHEVKLVGFGTFEPREIVAHEGKHPRTGEKITMPATKTPVFRAGKDFKDMLNN